MPRFDGVGMPAAAGRYHQKTSREERIETEPVSIFLAVHGRHGLRSLIAAFIALIVSAAISSAPAQQADQTLSAGHTAPPKSTERATPADPAPTPEHIAKARHLILATGISRSFQIIIPEFMDQIGNTLTQSRPDLVQDMGTVLTTLRPEFEKQSDEMIDQSARIYAGLLAEKDIDAILAFFDSDAGKKYVAAQPLFLNQLVSGMQAWQQKVSINMMSRVREEMKKKGHDL